MTVERADLEKHEEGIRAFLTPERCSLIDEFEALAFEMGRVDVAQRIGVGANDTYGGNHHITQLLIRKNLKQCEFAEALVNALRSGHTGVALSLSRTLLEGSIELAWAADDQSRGSSEERLMRVLRRGYEAMSESSVLPPSEQAVIEEAKNRRLKLSPESARNAMQQMDAAERRAGGEPYWESHYKQFALSSDYVHTSFLGPGRFAIIGGEMHVDMNPGAIEGVLALRWGFFYFVRGADAVLRLAGLDSESIVSRYAAVQGRLKAELDALENPSDARPG